MEKRVDLFDRVANKPLVLAVFWSVLRPTTAFAVDLLANPGLVEAPKDAPGPNLAVFASITGICTCASSKVKTGILLVGVEAIFYSALCSKDKPLIIACTFIATYVSTKLGEELLY